MFKGKKLKQIMFKENASLAKIFTSSHYTTSPVSENFDMVFVTEDVVQVSNRHNFIKTAYFPITSLECWVLADELTEESKPTKKNSKNDE